MGSKVSMILKSKEAEVEPKTAVLLKHQEEGFYHFLLSLNSGENTFTVRYLTDNSSVKEETLRVISFPSTNNRWKTEFYQFHKTELSRGVCKTCHNIRADNPSGCSSCHREVEATRDKVIHPPFEEGDCNLCHEDFKVDVDVCGECHELDEPPRRHSPFAIGDCFFCHSAHSAPNTQLLRLPVKELCGQCHKISRYIEGIHPVTPHPQESQGITCVDCHSPHGTAYPNFLINEPGGFCSVCHKSR